MRSEDRCKSHYHGGRCRLSRGHSGNHTTGTSCEVGREWSGGYTPELKPRVVKRARKAQEAVSRGMKLYCACRQYNREHGYIVPTKGASTNPLAVSFIVRGMHPSEFDRLWMAGMRA